MKVDVTFVNFPSSNSMKDLVSSRIEQHVKRFNNDYVAARAVFTTDGNLHHVRLNVIGGTIKMTVTGSSTDAGRSLDKAIDKLDGVLRKAIAKKKEHRFENSELESLKAVQIKQQKKWKISENVFDRFEEEYVRDFEDAFERAS